jgi:type II secretory pathway pseudopilin PulG
MRNLKLRKSKAMTLVELMIYLAITMIVLVVVIDLVTRVAQNKSQSTGQEEVTANARFLIERLTYSIQQSSDVTGSYPANSLNLTVKGEEVGFILEGGQIVYHEGTGPAVALTNNLVEIIPLDGDIFTKIINNPAQSVQIKFQVKYKTNNLSRDFETTVLARGK